MWVGDRADCIVIFFLHFVSCRATRKSVLAIYTQKRRILFSRRNARRHKFAWRGPYCCLFSNLLVLSQICFDSLISSCCYIWAPSSEFVSSSIPSWQIVTAHAQPFRGAMDLAFCLKVPLDSLLVWASSEGSGETARMRRLAWTFAPRIGDTYQIRFTRPICTPWSNLDLAELVMLKPRLIFHSYYKRKNQMSHLMTKLTKWSVRPAKTQISQFDQSSHMRSVGSWGPNVSSCGQLRLWSNWADLSLRWAHMPFCWFLSWGGSDLENNINCWEMLYNSNELFFFFLFISHTVMRLHKFVDEKAMLRNRYNRILWPFIKCQELHYTNGRFALFHCFIYAV